MDKDYPKELRDSLLAKHAIRSIVHHNVELARHIKL